MAKRSNYHGRAPKALWPGIHARFRGRIAEHTEEDVIFSMSIPRIKPTKKMSK